ncbi:hypothetical protein J6590_032341 [Homalodisca vitripennis]|nr:hypothetical protein J6590_032341 [Homalodisca vitripennis]
MIMITGKASRNRDRAQGSNGQTGSGWRKWKCKWRGSICGLCTLTSWPNNRGVCAMERRTGIERGDD